MRPFVMFAAAFALAMFAGCQENAVEPIIAAGAEKPVAAFRTLMINETVDLRLPDGRVVFAAVAGEVTYRLVPVEKAALAKEIPPKQAYDLILMGKGQIQFAANAAKDGNALAKPEVWYFAGNLTTMVENGANGIDAIFTIQGAKWTAHYHMTFGVARGALEERESIIDFHQAAE